MEPLLLLPCRNGSDWSQDRMFYFASLPYALPSHGLTDWSFKMNACRQGLVKLNDKPVETFKPLSSIISL